MGIQGLFVMADFILLPPRPLVGEQIAYLLRPYLPGVPVTSSDGAKILEELSYAGGDDAYIVFREDLGDIRWTRVTAD